MGNDTVDQLLGLVLDLVHVDVQIERQEDRQNHHG